MITAYPFEQEEPLAGTVDGPHDPTLDVARTNPAVAQEGTLTVGGTASDGLYQAKFYHPDEPDNPIVAEFTRAAGETNAQIAAALAAEAVKKLILKAAVTVVGAVITAKFANSLVTYTVTTSAPGLGTLVWAQTVAAGGSLIPFGRFVVGGGDGITAKLPAAASTVGKVLGVVQRSLQVQQNPDPTGEDGYGPGREMAILGSGHIRVEVEEDIAPGDTPYMRIIASGNKTKLGIVGKSADGGNCIDISSICSIDVGAKTGRRARLMIHIPLKAA